MNIVKTVASYLIGLAFLSGCRPDSWNGEDVRIQSSRGLAFLSVLADHQHDASGGIPLVVMISMAEPAPEIRYSEIALTVFDQEGSAMAYRQSDPELKRLFGVGGAGWFSANALYLLEPKRGQEPTSARVTWEGKTYTSRKVRWLHPDSLEQPGASP